MPLCKYELERLANIARNKAVLDQLGLGGDNSLKKPKAPVVRKPKSDSDDDEDEPAIPKRRSTRNVGTPPTYVQLSDEFMCMEERGLLKRASRDIKQLAPRFDEIQAAEAAERDKKRAQKAAQQAKVVRETMERERAERVRVAAEQRIANANANANANAQRAGGDPPWPTKGYLGICPLCNGQFVVRRNGILRKHDCKYLNPFLPEFF